MLDGPTWGHICMLDGWMRGTSHIRYSPSLSIMKLESTSLQAYE